MPSIYKMVKSFVKEAVEYSKQGAPHVTAKQYENRLKVCKSCPDYKADIGRCGLCGCLVEHKAKWGTAKCPADPERWEELKVKNGKTITVKHESKNTTTEVSDKAQSTDTED
jgi:hypothetical protein